MKVTARSSARTYLVFEALDGRPNEWREVLTETDGGRGVVARNGENAMRKAYRLLAEERGEHPETTLVVVSERMWRPMPVKARVPRTSLAIEIG